MVMHTATMSSVETMLMGDPGDALTSRGVTDREGVDMNKPSVPAKGKPLADDDPRHGTSNGYTTYGCRCKDCCQAHTEYARRYAVKGAESRRLWGAKNKHRLAEAIRLWRIENAEYAREYARVYRDGHREEALEAICLWRIENSAHIREYASAVRDDHKARWAIEDPYADTSLKRCPDCQLSVPRTAFGVRVGTADGLATYCRPCCANRVSARRARKIDQWVEDVDRDVVWARDQGICYLCETPADPDMWHLEHRVPISLGGPHSYANTAVSHPACNLRKSSNPWSGIVWAPPESLDAHV